MWDLGILDNEIRQTDWIDLTCGKDCEWACDNLRSTKTKQTIAKYTKAMPQRWMGRQLFNNALWQLMKKLDADLKTSLKSGLETDCLNLQKSQK